MPRDPRHDAHWTTGPAGWAPVALLAALSILGFTRAVTTDGIGPGAACAPTPIESARLNCNTASFAQLQLLPRIGPALARRIIEDRDANGPFKDAQDFQRVRGIGPRTAERVAAVADFSADR
ncbi:MAG: helix-hairpin-helix domain-containing protein [Phycisphaeraceae bacterium]|nr:helix-hairpin-helix domain-containing protein [Phycisphaeraceae bacterium]MCB9847806.1 helix-hairpin-helix domain-containing protein [Phycisphaeraceae bacterium]